MKNIKKSALIVMFAIILVTFFCSSFVSVCLAGGAAQAATGQSGKFTPGAVVICENGGPKTVMCLISRGLGEMIWHHLGIPMALTSCSGLPGVLQMDKNNVHLCLINVVVAKWFYQGTGPFKEYGPQRIRSLFQGMPLEWEIIVLKKSGIKSFADLKGKRVWHAPEQAKQMIEPIFFTTLEAHGLKKEDLAETHLFLDIKNAEKALVTGKADAIIYPATNPTPGLSDFADKHDIRILNVDDAAIEKVRAKLPFLKKVVIPGGTYRGMDEDIQVTGYTLYFGCNRDLSDEFAYNVVKMVYDNYEEWTSIADACKHYTLEGIDEIDMLPYHPGAVKYYKEKGVWTEAHDRRQAKLLGLVPPEYR